MADDGLDAGAAPGADPLAYVNGDADTQGWRDNYTFWKNWARTQAARQEKFR